MSGEAYDINERMRNIAGRTVPLNSPCDADDVCDDVNAACVGGLCHCRPTYYQQADRCSQSRTFGLSLSPTVSNCRPSLDQSLTPS